ncbi:MAG: TIGR02453 family protein [Planktotalea sp.]
MSELSQNNNREWFTENKERYESQLKKPAKHLLDAIAPELSKMLDQPVTTKLFRANRDVRFSKDKTPYTLHLHMMWSPQGNGTQPVYFFGIANDYVTTGAGLMGFDKAQQSAWRAWVSEREGDALQSKVDAALKDGATLRKPELKRVPSPFEKDHPRADLLRHKSLTLWKEIGTAAEAGLEAAILSTFKEFNPVMDDLRSFL